MIKANAHKYSVSAMCRVLQVNRSTYYYEAAAKKDESELTADIQEIFRKSRNHYGTRKIKKELADCGKQVSRRRIGRIMKQEGLVSSYTTAQFKPQKDRCNESKVENVLNRQFQNQPYRNVVLYLLHCILKQQLSYFAAECVMLSGSSEMSLPTLS